MAREKNTVPSTLAELVETLKRSLSDYQENLTDFADKDVPAGDYAKAKKSLDDGHAAVLKLKDLHNGLYRFLPKAATDGKPKENAAITMAKEQAERNKAEAASQDKPAEAKTSKAAKKAAAAKAEKPAEPTRRTRAARGK